MKFKYKLWILLPLLLFTFILLLSGCKKDCEKQVECSAVSRTTLGIVSSQTGNVNLPGNAGILKIIASISNTPQFPIDGALLASSGQLSFFHFIPINAATQEGSFIITFEQPLCVGEEGAALLLDAVRSDGVDPIAFIMTLTVVYCPDFCANNGCILSDFDVQTNQQINQQINQIINQKINQKANQ